MLTQGEIDEAPKVKLGGKEWPVPLLVPRQQRVAVPGILHLMPMFSVAAGQKQIPQLTEADFDILVRTVVAGLQRANPSLTVDQFLDTVPATMTEMIVALGIIAQQSGLLKHGAVESEPSGEAQGNP